MRLFEWVSEKGRALGVLIAAVLIAALTATLLTVPVTAAQASVQESYTMPNSTTTVTYRGTRDFVPPDGTQSGLSLRLSETGANPPRQSSSPTTNLNAVGVEAGDYIAPYDATTIAMGIRVAMTCPAATTLTKTAAQDCTTTDGTLTITFSAPVDNPLILIGGLGGGDACVSGSQTQSCSFNAVLDLTGSSASSSVRLSEVGGGNGNSLRVTGTRIAEDGASVGPRCNAGDASNGIASKRSACGTVQVTGTGITSLTFSFTGHRYLAANYSSASAAVKEGKNVVDQFVMSVVPGPQMSIQKTSTKSTVAKAGDTIPYTFTVKNTGGVNMTNVSISDQQQPPASNGNLSAVSPASVAQLAPGQSQSFSATYTVTQADIDNGSIADTATVNATPPPGTSYTPPPEASLTVPAMSCAAPNLYTINSSGVLFKLNTETGENTRLAQIGSATQVFATAVSTDGRYAYAITSSSTGGSSTTRLLYRYDASTGQTTSTTVVWNGGSIVGAASGPGGAVYYLTNNASGSARAYTLYKYDPSAGTSSAVGTFPSVGGVQYNGDLDFDAHGNLYIAESNPNGADGALVVITAQMLARGDIANPDVVTALPAKPSEVLYNGMALGTDGLVYVQYGTAASSSAPVKAHFDVVNPNTGAFVRKDVEQSGFGTVGLTDMASCQQPGALYAKKDVVGRKTESDQFTLTIQPAKGGNAGTTSGTGTGLQEGESAVAGPVMLVPGTEYTVTENAAGTTDLAQYSTTWACHDTANGDRLLASGQGTSGTFLADGSAQKPAKVVCVFRNTPSLPAITIAKTADASALSSPPKPGQVITYSFEANNTGNVTLTGVEIKDGLAGLSTLNYTWPDSDMPGVLAPGQKVSATATYAITQADIDAGKVVNSATSQGTPPGGGTTTPPTPATTTTELPPSPAITIGKKADVSALQAPPKPGDLITYTFEAENTGNVTLTGVAIRDQLVGLSELAYTWPTADKPGVLAPGQKVTATASYAISQADIDNGHVANSATSEGSPPGGGTTTPPEPAETDTPLPPAPSITIVKTADASAVSSPAEPGQLIVYHFEAQNTGNVTLTAVVIRDELPGLSELSYSWPAEDKPGMLEPGETVTATASYPLTQADIDAGQVENSATSEGTPPGGGTVTPPEPAKTRTPLTPAPTPTPTPTPTAPTPTPPAPTPSPGSPNRLPHTASTGYWWPAGGTATGPRTNSIDTGSSTPRSTSRSCACR